MFQKFYTDTLISKFIKGLLYNTNIPLYNFVTIGDKIIEGGIYIYDHWIIKCTSTGSIELSSDEILYPSMEIYPDTDLFPGRGITKAGFIVLAHYNNDIGNKYSYRYKSNINYYDPETHYHLGNYIRYLNAKYKINLLPYYNCYNQTSIESLSLELDTTVKGGVRWISKAKPGYKLAAVPIKFDKMYTIAIECPTQVLMRSVLYGPMGMIKTYTEGDDYYSDRLDDSGIVYSNLSFKSPITYKVSTDSLDVFNREKYLYLLIQLPVNNNSSIVVLEGDYSISFKDIIQYEQSFNNTIWNRYQQDDYGNKLPYLTFPKHKEFNVLSQYSLLILNTQETYAFSNRLIEYLLNNVIGPGEELTTNIEKVQLVLSNLDESYRNKLVSNMVELGVWDKYIPEAILRCINSYNNNCNSRIGVYLNDMDGNINRQVEDFFLQAAGLRIDIPIEQGVHK